MRKIKNAVAVAAVTMISSEAFSQELPLSVQSQINFSKAGLLRSFYESDQYGSVQWRIGQARSTIGGAKSPSAPQNGYSDKTTDSVVPIKVLHSLSGGNSDLLFGIKGTFPNGYGNQNTLDGEIYRLDAEYLHYIDTDTMLGIGAFYEVSDLNSSGIASSDIESKGGGVRVDAIRKFSAHWGVAARAEYYWGTTKVTNPITSSFSLIHKQGDDHIYTQAELIGQYRQGDIDAIPAGWVLHPALGIQYQHNYLESTANNLGVVSSGVVGDSEEYGTWWTHLRLEKEAPPGEWTPTFLLGYEREYVNNLDKYVQEPSYGVVGTGISMLTQGGMRVGVEYSRHQGFNGNRINSALLGTLNFRF